MTDLEQRWRQAEQVNERRKAASVRRGPISLVAVMLGVALVVGIVAAVDLRRLQTPSGTALAWVGATLFGDCTRSRELAIDDDARSPEERCRALRAATEDARDDPDEVEFVVRSVRREGDEAEVVLTVDLVDAEPQTVTLELRRIDDEWRVVVDDDVREALAVP